MTTLDSVVNEVVDGFMDSGELFTALDVSNKVKLSLPFARHGEVRDMVRDLWSSKMQNSSWARTPISVTLADGRQVEALLYHPLSDSWDLDSKYDAQKRAQAALMPGAPVIPAASTTVVTGNAAVPAVVVKPSPTAVAKPAAPVNQSIRDKWASLFDSQPSLFPLK